MFVLAAAAVWIVAIQIVWHKPQWWVWGEVVALVVIVGLYIWGRRHHVHEQWIAGRHLGERLRDGFFLALVGAEEGSRPVESIGPGTVRWTERAFRTVWLERPPTPATKGDVGPLSRFLAEKWLGEEAD